MGMPAARLLDLTAHGSSLIPGLGSSNVLIGGLPAWRGLTAAQGAQFVAAFADCAADIAKAQAAATAAKGTPGAGAAEANLHKTIKDSAAKMANLIASSPADKNMCTTPYIIIPHGIGIVVSGSTTVQINGLAACRIGDPIQETLAPNIIALGLPTVLIGG
jgi:uncharacterized Zn-binding protein involved in type VI secretion